MSFKVVAQHFTVEGVGEFPYDMLRYDGCFPADEQQTGVMAGESNRRQVRIARYSEKGRWPTGARWQSFGWVVLADSFAEER